MQKVTPGELAKGGGEILTRRSEQNSCGSAAANNGLWSTEVVAEATSLGQGGTLRKIEEDGTRRDPKSQEQKTPPDFDPFVNAYAEMQTLRCRRPPGVHTMCTSTTVDQCNNGNLKFHTRKRTTEIVDISLV